MSDTLIVADALIVVPKSHSFILSSRDEVLTFLHNCKSIKFSRLGTVEHTDGLSIEAVPVSDLAVGSGGKELRFVWMVDYLFEHS